MFKWFKKKREQRDVIVPESIEKLMEPMIVQ